MASLPVYPPITRATMRGALSARLNNAQFWSTPELNAYLQEALTSWQAMARYWRALDTFDTQPGVFFYDLSTQLSGLSYNTTDAQMLSVMEYQLIEPQSGIPSNPTWQGTDMFPQDAYTGSLNRRRDRFLLESQSVVGHYTANGIVAGSPRLTLPASLIDLRRVAFQKAPASGTVNTSIVNGTFLVTNLGTGDAFISDGSWNGLPITINGVAYVIAGVISAGLLTLTKSAGTQDGVAFSVGGPYTVLWRDDEFGANAYSSEWTTSVGLPTPLAYSVVVAQPYTLQFLPPPGDVGALDVLAIAQGAPLNPSTGVVLGIPDNFSWAVKWGAMADLLSQDGPGRDLQRAAYADQRFREGVALCRQMPTVINGTINGQVAELDTVFNFDSYQSGWHNTSGQPTALGLASQTMLATSSVPDDIYSVGLDVVTNCPVMTDDTTPIGITVDQMNVIVSEAQHIAIFKEGGQEFANSMVLHENFVKYAAMYRSKSLGEAHYWPDMASSDQLEFEQRRVLLS